jgi:hypothetical protein
MIHELFPKHCAGEWMFVIVDEMQVLFCPLLLE